MVEGACEMILRKKPEIVKGGLADGKPDAKYLEDQLRMGIDVEGEHTASKAMAKEIAKDHLEEHPRYYTALKKMENNLEKKSFFAGLREEIMRISGV